MRIRWTIPAPRRENLHLVHWTDSVGRVTNQRSLGYPVLLYDDPDDPVWVREEQDLNSDLYQKVGGEV